MVRSYRWSKKINDNDALFASKNHDPRKFVEFSTFFRENKFVRVENKHFLRIFQIKQKTSEYTELHREIPGDFPPAKQ